MIMAMTLGSSASILTAESNGVGQVGFGSGFGSLTRAPVGLAAQGSSVNTLSVALGDLNLFVTGDQTTWLTGKTLHLGGTSYTVASADTFQYLSGSDQTQVEWENTGTIVDGETYIVRIE